MGFDSLWIEAGMGMAGDMFSAALIDLGAEEEGVLGAMRVAGEMLGSVTATLQHQMLPNGSSAARIEIDGPTSETLSVADAPGVLERALRAAAIGGVYAGFAHRALAVLCQAERAAHSILAASSGAATGASLAFIGHAHTPYVDRAPYQPTSENTAAAEAFFIDVDPCLAEALSGLDSFSHLYVVSYLERSPGYSLAVRPPWKSGASLYGLFATRSPNRPNPIGLTRVRLRRIEGARIYTGPLDLFDGTPVLDLKPYIQTLDGAPGEPVSDGDPGNDGWLAGSDHLELHRRGIPHQHPGGGQLHEARNIVVGVVGAAWALQFLRVDLGNVCCLEPVRVGGGTIESASHGRLSVPAPATQTILDGYGIPYEGGPVDVELLTPTGAAILAALSPSFVADRGALPHDARVGAGMGRRAFRSGPPNILRLHWQPGHVGRKREIAS